MTQHNQNDPNSHGEVLVEKTPRWLRIVWTIIWVIAITALLVNGVPWSFLGGTGINLFK